MDSSDFLMPTYNPLPVTFTHGEGVWVYDGQGHQYLDAVSGIGVCSLGHAHPAITHTIQTQASKILHSSNLYQIENQQRLAEKLTQVSGLDAVFFCNSGAEASEAAIKLARLYAHQSKSIADPSIIVMRNAFHGRTMGAWSASRPDADSPFAPLLPGFVQADFGDLKQIEQLLDKHPECCAVMLEPIQGEAGVRVAAEGFLSSLASLCKDKDVLLIADEVQTGIARTGRWFACQHEDVTPDIITSAKALGNGVPIGACIARTAIAEHFSAGSHGSTFGGNPLATAVGLTVLKTIEEENLLAHCNEVGQYLLGSLRDTLDSAIVKEVRGKGLMVGIELNKACADLSQIALQNKLLINITGGNTIRLLPPIICQNSDIDLIVERLQISLQTFKENL